MNLLNLPRQYQTIKPEIDEAVQSILSSGRFTGGPFVESFEREFASYVGANYCVGVGSGTDALRIALEAAGITGEVIVPVNTCFATAEAVVQAGATPVFCDCAEEFYTLSLAHLSDLITPQTEAIIPVHLYGLPCQMDLVMKIAERHNLFVLEDCSHAHGAEYKGAPVGSFGHAAAFSFNPVKILGAAGDAGGIVTNWKSLAWYCRSVRDHGRHDKYVHERIGYNSRLDSLQAAILSVKLKHLDEWVVRRRGVATSYRVHLLAHYPEIMRPVEAINALHSYHQFVVRVSGRDRVQMALSAAYSIETGIHYPMLLSRQSALLHLGTRAEDTPMAAAYAKEILSLPINESMRVEEVYAVCDALIEVVNGP